MAYAKAKYNFSKQKEEIGVFKKYDAKWVQFVVNLFKVGSISRKLIEREYGKNLDGVGALHNLTYAEQQRLYATLKIIEDRLTCITILENKGESSQAIKNKFSGKNDDAIETMVASILSENKKVSLVTTKFKTKKDILAHYQIEEEILEGAIELLENGDDRRLYKYTYQIGTNGMSKDSIFDMFQLDEKTYQEKLLEIEAILPELINRSKKNKEEMGFYEETLKQNVVIPEEKDKTSKTQNRVHKTQKITSILKKSFKDNFQDVAYTDFYLHQISSYRENFAPNATFLLKKAYGSNLDKELDLESLKQTEIRTLEKEISTYNKILRERKCMNGCYLPNTFLELFQTEENKESLTLEDVLIMKSPGSHVYQLLQKIYGEDFTEEKKEVSLTANEKVSIREFVQSGVNHLQKISSLSLEKSFIDNFKNISYTKFYFNQVLSYRASVAPQRFLLLKKAYGSDLDEEFHLGLLNETEKKLIEAEINTLKTLFKEKKTLNGYYLPDTFLELFQTEDNKESLTLEDVLITKSSGSHVYQLLQKIYGEDFTERKKDIPLTSNDMGSIKEFVVLGIEKIKRRESFPYADYFIDNLKNKEFSGEQWESYLDLQANRSKNTYKKLTEIYGEGLKEKAKKKKIAHTLYGQIQTFIASLDKLIEKEKISEKTDTQDFYFMDNFIKEEMSEEEKQKIIIGVGTILELYKNTKGYKVSQLLFGEHLNESKKKVVLSKKQRNNYYYLIQDIRIKLAGNKKNILDVFYEKEEQTEENIEKFKDFLEQYKETNIEKYTILMEIFNEKGELIIDKYSPKQRSVFAHFSKFVRQIGKGKVYPKKVSKNKRSKRENSQYFMDYFVEGAMSIQEKEEIEKKINYFLDTYIPNMHMGYQAARQLFGANLKDAKHKVSLSKQESRQFIFLVSTIRNFISIGVVKKRRPLQFVNIFTTYDTPKQEREWIKQQVLAFLETIPKSNLYYQVGEKLYGRNLLEEYNSLELTNTEKSQFTYLVNMVRNHLQQELVRVQKARDGLVEKIVVVQETEEIEETVIEQEFTPEKTATITSNSSFSILEKEAYEFTTISLENRTKYIEEVLQSEPIKSFMETLTELEQELIYLKLVQKENPSLTDEVISHLTNIPVEDIKNYEIHSKEDMYNSINQYIKR